jgi:hypothetical protein
MRPHRVREDDTESPAARGRGATVKSVVLYESSPDPGDRILGWNEVLLEPT